MKISQKEKKAGVIGCPIHHSRSPLIHGYWLQKYSIEGSYDAIELKPDRADIFFKDLKISDYAGLNVTIPHKEKIVPYLDRLDEAAQKIGAVNTVWRDGPDLVGGNTDWIGFSKNLTHFIPNWQDQRKTALVLGAGGAARAILYALLQTGITKIILANRTLERAEILRNEFGAKIRPVSLHESQDHVVSADLIINTTSLGMDENPPLPLELEEAQAHCIVTDIVYKPLETPLLAKAKARGLQTVDGLGMLLYQAAPGFEKWFGQKGEVSEELRALILADLGL